MTLLCPKSTTLVPRLVALASFPPLLLRLAWALLHMRGAGKRGGERVQDALNAIFVRAQAHGWLRPIAAFDQGLADNTVTNLMGLTAGPRPLRSSGP